MCFEAPYLCRLECSSWASTDAQSPRVLSSALLKEQVRLTPLRHKDYSPCMRITRSMKRLQLPRED